MHSIDMHLKILSHLERLLKKAVTQLRAAMVIIKAPSAECEVPEATPSDEIQPVMVPNIFRVPVLQVQLGDMYWWTCPRYLGDDICFAYFYMWWDSVIYQWDWGLDCQGDFYIGDQPTSRSRYRLDFITMQQQNLDTQKCCPIRFAWIAPGDERPVCTGQFVPMP